jgi:outer membrane receptor protein involved in Fe transport
MSNKQKQIPLRLKKRVHVLFLSIFFIFCSLKIYAQNENCNCSILEAKNLYNIGLFSELRNNLSCCLNSSKKDIKNNAREILALTEIAQDDLLKAANWITEIVLSDMNYQLVDSNLVLHSLFQKIKRENTKITVSSVSKKPEDIRTAPASVILISAAQIRERGYMDIVDILSDIPGFDISRLYSTPNTNIYQLGFRQDITERTLFMVDGVEENDVWSNYVYASTQYPISNIKAVEILFGPASTMYGARAFVGTINIITYSPKERAGYKSNTLDENPDNKWYSYGRISMGSYNTRDLDITIGNDGSEKLNFQITARINQSDGHDMSDESFFNYDKKDLEVFEYDHIQIKGSSDEIDQYLTENNILRDHPFIDISQNDSSETLSLSSQGIARAKALDQLAYTSKVNGRNVSYSNTTMNYFVGAKLSYDKFIFGFRMWKRKEGFGNYHDLDMAPSINGSIWSPENKTAYLKYDTNINENITLSFLSTFKHHRLGDETKKVNFIPFGNPNMGYEPKHIVNYSSLLDTNYLVKEVSLNGSQSFPEIGHGWRNKSYFYQGTQGRNELRLFYDNERLSAMSGLEYRVTAAQGDYLSAFDFNWRDYESGEEYEASYYNLEENDEVNDDYFGNAQSKGTAYNQMEGSNIYVVYDFGAFIQASYQISKDRLYITGGLRYDNQRVRFNSDQKSGFSDLLPRLGIALNVNKNITVKANAAKGYQAPSLWTKYSTGANRIPNPRVRPERIQYIDLSVSNYGKLFNWNVTGFVHRIEDAISSKRLPIKTGRYAGKDIHVNIGEYDISGIFGQIGVNYNSFRLFANATFTNGLKTNEKDINQIASSFPGYDLGLVNSNSESPILNTQIADIAKYKANAGITKTFDSKYIFATINIRANYVGEKMVGFGTTAPTNPGILTGLDQYNDSENINSQGKFQFNNASIPEYFLVNGNIMFSLKSLSGVRLGLQVRNILNEKFYHPGPAQAGSIIGLIDRPASMSYENYYSSTSQNKYVIYVPQMLRNFIFSVLYDF